MSPSQVGKLLSSAAQILPHEIRRVVPWLGAVVGTGELVVTACSLFPMIVVRMGVPNLDVEEKLNTNSVLGVTRVRLQTLLSEIQLPVQLSQVPLPDGHGDEVPASPPAIIKPRSGSFWLKL